MDFKQAHVIFLLLEAIASKDTAKLEPLAQLAINRVYDDTYVPLGGPARYQLDKERDEFVAAVKRAIKLF